MPDAVYDHIGAGYATRRRADPRIQRAVDHALGSARRILNVGAGGGSYEPVGPVGPAARQIVALDPSVTMLAQRPVGAAPAVRGVAEALPFADGAFDTALAVLTVHHWSDPAAGLAEVRRVSRRQVVLTWDPAITASYWLVVDYLPEIGEHEAGLEQFGCLFEHLDVHTVIPVPVPADCTDGFLAAYWSRPREYLEADVRAAISGLSLLDQDVVAAALERLRGDVDSGAWHRRHGDVLDHEEYDAGYRLVIAGDR